MSAICRLCLKGCKDFKSLYSANGQASELLELTLAFFHPKIVDMEAATHLTVVCLECVGHIKDFHQFQESIAVAQLSLNENHQMVAIKTEREEGSAEDSQYAVEFSVQQVCSEEENGTELISKKVKETSEVEVKEEFLPLYDEVQFRRDDANKTGTLPDSSDQNSIGSIEYISKDVKKTSELKVKEEFESMYDEVQFRRDDVNKTGISPEACDPNIVFNPDFTIKPELEIIDVPQGHTRSDHSSEDEANDFSTPDTFHNTKKDSKYKCTICGNSFAREFNFTNHMRWQHETIVDPPSRNGKKRLRYSCDYCYNSFAAYKSWQRHLRNQHGIKEQTTDVDGAIEYDETTKKYSCKICAKSYILRMKIVKHMGKLHPEIQQIRKNSDNTSTASRAYACEVFKCKFCEHAEVFKDALVTHIEERHGIATPKLEFDYDEITKFLKCKLCTSAFGCEKSLRHHMKYSHWEQGYVALTLDFNYNFTCNLLKCKLCSSSHKNVHCLVRHVAQQQHWLTQITQHECHLCKSSFLSQEGLTQHYAAEHWPLGPYPCDGCGKTFGDSNSLTKHRAKVHTFDPKPHKCDTCGKTFRSATLLKNHLVSHTQKKTHTCGLCPKKFKYARNLRRHMKLVHMKGHKGS